MPSSQCGLTMLVLAGLLQVAMLVWSKFLKQGQWPYFRLMGSGFVVLWIGILIALLLTRAPLPPVGKRKWVVLRGTFATLNFSLQVLAVRVGTPMGDVASLSSINMVVAALLGRLFLGEPLRTLYVFALCCSLCGAVLIARPSFIFGSSESAHGESWVGYLIAVLAGFVQGCIFICSRKAAAVSVWIMSFSSMFQATWPFLLLPYTPILEDYSLDVVVAAPFQATAWIGILAGTVCGTNIMLSAGSMLSPAAVSSLTFTSTQMVFGYAAQAVMFATLPNTLTILGATLMLAGVLIMAISRWRDARATSAAQMEPSHESATDFADVATSPADHAEEHAESIDNLATFIANEFAADAAHDQLPIRKRSSTTAVESQQVHGAQIIGRRNLRSEIPCLSQHQISRAIGILC